MASTHALTSQGVASSTQRAAPAPVHVFGITAGAPAALFHNPCISIDDAGHIVSIHEADAPISAAASHSINIRACVPSHALSTPLFLLPGLLDLQFNGGFDVDFSQAPGPSSSLSVSSLRTVCTQLCSTGVTGFLATFVSSSRSTYEAALPLFEAMLHEPAATPAARILGLHMEGPFLSPHRKGAHALVHLTSPARAAGRVRDAAQDVITAADQDTHLSDDDCHTALQSTYGADFTRLLGEGHVRMLTLAPDLNGAASVTRYLSSRGVLVCMGHSDATHAAVERCVNAGARGVTHMFNAMRALTAREAGLVAALTHTYDGGVRLHYGLICDGAHVCPATTRVATCTHMDGLFLVTDAMCALGCGVGARKYGDIHVRVREGNATYPCTHAVVEGTDTLAGAVAPLCECVHNLVKLAGVPTHAAVHAATAKPAAISGLERVGSLRPGSRADFVVTDEAFTPLATYVAGKCAYTR